MELRVAVNAYVSERSRNRSLAPRSIEQVRYTLWRLSETLGPDRDVRAVTLNEVSAWLASFGCGPRTLLAYASHAHGLFKWLQMRDEIGRDPFVGLQLPRAPSTLPRALEPEEVAAVLEACADTREVLIALLMVQEGLRAGEVAGLELGDVSLSKRAVTVRKSKGGRQRVVPLTDETRGVLARYLAESPHVGAGALIRSKQNPRVGISAGRVSKMLTRIMYDSGVKQYPMDGKSGHALRHTAASDVCVEAEYDVRVVQQFLGHATAATSMIYLRAAAADRLRSAVNGRHYRREAS